MIPLLVAIAPATLSKVWVLDAREIKSYQERLLIASAQGLFNRRGLNEGVYVISDGYDEDWLKELRARKIRIAGRLASTRELLDKVGVKSAVVFGDAPSHSGDLATMVAACEDSLLVADPALIATYDLNIKKDLRKQFTTNVEGYRWVLANYGAQLDPKAVSFTVPFVTPTHRPYELRDFHISRKMFTFWISGSDEKNLPGADRPAEESYIREVLTTKFDPNIPVYGYPWSGDTFGPGEWDGITILSESSKFLVPTDNFTNLSLWNRFPPSTKRFPTTKPSMKAKPGARYAAFVMSDGDNACTFRNFFFDYWRSGKVDRVPMGWTMAPTLRELAPPIYDWYVDHLPKGHSVGSGVSGIGYCSLENYGKGSGRFGEAAYRDFLRMTDESLQRNGFEWSWIMRYGRFGGKYIKDFLTGVPTAKAVMGGYGNVARNAGEAIEPMNGRVAFHNWVDIGNPKEAVGRLQAWMNDPNGPRFTGIFILNWNYSPDQLKEVAEAGKKLGITWVTPVELAHLAQQANP